jgi:hypothetical protein
MVTRSAWVLARLFDAARRHRNTGVAFEILHFDLERILVSVLVSVGLLYWDNRRHILTARDFHM